MEYLSIGGGTPPQWNINPQGGGVHHLSGIFFPASHFPQCPIFHLCCMDSHSSQLSISMMVFFVVGGCVGGGGVPDFFLSLSDRKEGREGAGATLLLDFC